MFLLPSISYAFIHGLGSSQDPSRTPSTLIPSPFPPHQNHLFRLPPRQRLNTPHHILKRLLILPRRPLRPLHLPSIIPLDLKRRQHNPRVEPIDILLRIRGETFELLYEGEELVDVVAAWILALFKWSFPDRDWGVEGRSKRGERRGLEREGRGGEGYVRLHLSLLGQDSLVLRPDVGGDFYGGGAVGLADELDFLGCCFAWRWRGVC